MNAKNEREREWPLSASVHFSQKKSNVYFSWLGLHQIGSGPSIIIHQNRVRTFPTFGDRAVLTRLNTSKVWQVSIFGSLDCTTGVQVHTVWVDWHIPFRWSYMTLWVVLLLKFSWFHRSDICQKISDKQYHNVLCVEFTALGCGLCTRSTYSRLRCLCSSGKSCVDRWCSIF